MTARGRMLVSELCDLPLNADGTPRRKFFRREAREYGVMLKCRKANFPRDALRNRPACIEPFYVVSDRQKGFSRVYFASLEIAAARFVRTLPLFCQKLRVEITRFLPVTFDSEAIQMTARGRMLVSLVSEERKESAFPFCSGTRKRHHSCKTCTKTTGNTSTHFFEHHHSIKNRCDMYAAAHHMRVHILCRVVK